MVINKTKLFISVGIVAGLLFVAASFAEYLSNSIITNYSEKRVYSEIKDVPFNKVGILLGTSKYVRHAENPFYTYRIQAAVALIKAGKIKYIVVSGDNRQLNYNEPVQMKNDLVSAGVDPNVIFLDYAGFRTFDSMVRLKEIFGQTDVTVISQQFHNERAIYIASRIGVNAVGYNAQDVAESYGYLTMQREKLARVKVFMDFAFGKQPKFLGEKVLIP